MAHLPWAQFIKTHGRWLGRAAVVLAVLAVLALLVLALFASRLQPPPAPEPMPEQGAEAPPAHWHDFETRAAAVRFQVPAGFTPSVQDGKPLAESEAVYFPSADEPLAGFSFALCKQSDAQKCLPQQAQLIASAKVTVDGSSRGLQLISERPDGQGGRVLTWQTLSQLEPKLHVSFGLQYPVGYARAADLEDLYREWLARVELGAGGP